MEKFPHSEIGQAPTGDLPSNDRETKDEEAPKPSFELKVNDPRKQIKLRKKFAEHPEKLFQKLTEAQESDVEAMNHSEIAKELIAMGDAISVVQNLEHFDGVDHAEIAELIVEQGQGWLVIDNVEKFKDLNPVDLINKIEEVNPVHLSSIAARFDKFEGVHPDYLVKKMMAHGVGFVTHYPKLLEKYFNQEDLVDLYIKEGSGYNLALELPELKDLNHYDVAKRLIDAGQGYSLIQAWDKLDVEDSIQRGELLKGMVAQGLGARIVERIGNFQGANEQETIAREMIQQGQASLVAENIDKFTNYSHAEAVTSLIANDCDQDLLENLEKFDVSNYGEIARALVEKGLGEDVLQHIKKFGDLGREAVEEMIEANEQK